MQVNDIFFSLVFLKKCFIFAPRFLLKKLKFAQKMYLLCNTYYPSVTLEKQGLLKFFSCFEKIGIIFAERERERERERA